MERAVILLLVIASFIYSGSAFQCYSCLESATSTQCTSGADVSLVDCDKFYGTSGISYSCLKAEYQGTVTKLCVPKIAASASCDALENIGASCYICDEDSCNGSSRNVVSVVALVASLAIAYLTIRI